MSICMPLLCAVCFGGCQIQRACALCLRAAHGARHKKAGKELIIPRRLPCDLSLRTFWLLWECDRGAT